MEEQPVLLLAMVKEILYTGMVVAAIARAAIAKTAIAKTAIAKQEVLESSQIYISVKRNGDFLFIF
jgi:hypothetical protein